MDYLNWFMVGSVFADNIFESCGSLIVSGIIHVSTAHIPSFFHPNFLGLYVSKQTPKREGSILPALNVVS